MFIAEKVQFVDTTLRDGEQTAGIAFSAAEKMAIAKQLDQSGVPYIEAGVPAMGGSEFHALRNILHAGLNAKVIAWNRAVREDIFKSIYCGFSNIHISVPISQNHIAVKFQQDPAWVIAKLEECIDLAANYGCTVSVGAEDASRADLEFFLQVADVAAQMGAVRIRYADTVGCLTPFQTYNTMRCLQEHCPLPVEFHAHNDFGLATANTLAAVRAGIDLVSVTVNGIGERAGNASLEEVALALNEVYGCSAGIDLSVIGPLCQLVERSSGQKNFVYKPVSGERMSI
ncbi:MAG: Homocitrate synthase [Firmicutes bacterium]|nr:Homocitrate synthase [Bacillota bacterium]